MFEFLDGDDDKAPVRVKIVGIGNFGDEVTNRIYQDDVGDAEILSIANEEDLIDIEGMLEETDLLIMISKSDDEFAKRLSKRAKDFELPIKIGIFDSDCGKDLTENLDVILISTPAESAQAIIGISNLIKLDAMVSFDFNDIKMILCGRKNKSTIVVTNEDSEASSAVQAIIDSPKYRSKFENAKGLILQIVGSSDRLSMMEIGDASMTLQKSAPEDVEIIWGAQINDELDDRIRITILAIGFEE